MPFLLANKADVVIASFSITPERKKTIDFSAKYYNTPPAIVAPKDTDIKGVTPDGRLYTIARNVFTGNSEFAGAVFSPDGGVLFVNIMYPGLTFAIRGPWNAVRS